MKNHLFHWFPFTVYEISSINSGDLTINCLFNDINYYFQAYKFATPILYYNF